VAICDSTVSLCMLSANQLATVKQLSNVCKFRYTMLLFISYIYIYIYWLVVENSYEMKLKQNWKDFNLNFVPKENVYVINTQSKTDNLCLEGMLF
jgi:hypothetical protein